MIRDFQHIFLQSPGHNARAQKMSLQMEFVTGSSALFQQIFYLNSLLNLILHHYFEHSKSQKGIKEEDKASLSETASYATHFIWREGLGNSSSYPA